MYVSSHSQRSKLIQYVSEVNKNDNKGYSAAQIFQKSEIKDVIKKKKGKNKHKIIKLVNRQLEIHFIHGKIS